ncbi:sodium:solute symporter family transporter [Anaerophaga thermohalophila]|uniref:sodium:solute symporter family transporter n=1 Tax=Anaerophaga thermohalophila TaxID=177400 RepID=UPI0002F8717D
MSTTLVLLVILGFFTALFLISWFSSRNSDSETFFTGNRKSPWYLVAFGMIGATISGVTFISVPGEVGSSAWSYFQFILGNFVGYWIIALVLLPLYYKRNLVSIYTYLDQRFGLRSYKTGSFSSYFPRLSGLHSGSTSWPGCCKYHFSMLWAFLSG